MRLHLLGVTALASLMTTPSLGWADEPLTFRMTLKNHAFDPAELTVPAGKRLVLIAGREATIRGGPLAAGRYPFADEFHQDQAQGALTAAGE